MVDINLSKAVRSNLSSLQNTASLMSKTSDRLSTGNKVNSALDNPTNFFTASSLNSRAGDLNNLMDSMANGIKTIEAANNGLTSVTKTVESMQSTLRQARQDKSFKGESFQITTPASGFGVANAAFTVAGTSVALVKDHAVAKAVTAGADYAADTDATTIDIKVGSNSSVKVNLAANASIDAVITAINDNATLKGQGVIAGKNEAGTRLTLTSTTGAALEVAAAAAAVTGPPAVAEVVTGGFTAGAQTLAAAKAVLSVDELVTSINSNTAFTDKVRASADNGKLRLENLQTSQAVAVGKLVDGKLDAGVGGTGTATKSIGTNTVRADLVSQFNDLRNQLDRLSEDASFNGINLLRGDNLKITFNESGSSSIDVRSKEGKPVNSTNLGITAQQLSVADTDASIDTVLGSLTDALNKLRSQSSAFGSNLSVVQNRQDFTKSMINTLETGAGNLTLADMNQEAANMMALQTRQSLAQSTLSMANQADQGVLQLLR